MWGRFGSRLSGIAGLVRAGDVLVILADRSLPVQGHGATFHPVSRTFTRPRMTNDEYGAVFRASPDGILVVDEGGRIHDANPMAENLFGYTRAQLVGRSVDALVPEAVRSGHAAHRRQYVAHPRARPMGIGLQLRARRSDDTEFPVEISLSPLKNESGLFTIATVRDVSERKRLRDFGVAALQASEAERKRIARELHDDTAQRLSALLLRLRVIERQPTDQDVSDHLKGFRDELSACAEGIRRLARGLRPPELEDAGIVVALRAHTRALREGTGFVVELEADAVDDLLDQNSRLVLYRVVQEALSNVARHSGEGSATVTVRRGQANVVVSVVDRGRGFTDSTANSLGGGLGLIGMQERAAAVGGRVSVESNEGQGTRVTVTLPAVPA